jgi:hypothetical protein
MLRHKFAPGDLVQVEDRANDNVRPGAYTITRALPIQGAVCQYRAKSVLDNFERVLDEPLLHPLTSQPTRES